MQDTPIVSCSHSGRPGIAPECLNRALVLQVLFSIRSERHLVEQLRYNMLYRSFVGLSLDNAVWSATTFPKNRERFVDLRMTARLLDVVVEQARRRRLLSERHFCVDGRLVGAWGSTGGYRRKDDDDKPPDGSPSLRGQQHRSDTHACKTDPDALLYRKAREQPSRLCTIGYVLIDNRHALVVDAETTHATGTAEVHAALTTLDRRLTIGADKKYDQHRLIDGARGARVTPHVAQSTNGKTSDVTAGSTRRVGYAKTMTARASGRDAVGVRPLQPRTNFGIVGGMSAFHDRTAPDIRKLNDLGAEFDQEMINVGAMLAVLNLFIK